MAHTLNSSAEEVEAEGSEVHSHPQQHSKFEPRAHETLPQKPNKIGPGRWLHALKFALQT